MSGRRSGSATRRRLLLGGLAAALPAGSVALAQEPGGVIVVSRDRILREAAAARRLRDAEAELTERLQGQIDETKAAFAAEEEELARVRADLPEAEFEARVAAFDQRVRLARRVAQERAGLLQAAFQEARAAILAALPALMERLRVEAGAGIVLNSDQVLAMDAARDLTDRAIALFDAEGPSPALPEIDLSAPLLPPEGAAPAEGTAPVDGAVPPDPTAPVEQPDGASAGVPDPPAAGEPPAR